MYYYIYKLIDDSDRIYIGSTKNYKKRIYQHRYKYNACNSRLLNENFKSEILFENNFNNFDDVIELEYLYIEYYKIDGKCINSNQRKKFKEPKKDYYEDNKKELEQFYNNHYKRIDDQTERDNNKLIKQRYQREYQRKYYMLNKQIKAYYNIDLDIFN